MAEHTRQIPDGVLARRRARRRRRQRHLLVAALVTALVAGGAGTAWAMRSSSGSQYRLASVARGAVRQTVGADGTLAAHRTAAAAFAASGTVSSVSVSVGDKVVAGQTLARLNPALLNASVTAAKTTVAQAKQKLADDEQAQADGTTTSATSTTSVTSSGNASGASFTSSTVATAFVTAARPTGAPTAGSGSAPTSGSGGGSISGSGSASGTVAGAQQGVVHAQQSLDAAVKAQDDAVKTLIASCAAADESHPSTVAAYANSDGKVSGAGGSAAVVVTLLDANGDVAATTSANPQRLAENGTYSFAGLTTATSYAVQLVRSAVVNTSDCTAAVTTVEQGQRTLDTKSAGLNTALAALAKVISAQPVSQGQTGSASQSSQPTRGAGSTQTPTGGSAPGATQGSKQGSSRSAGVASGTSPSSSGTQSGVAVTAEQIAADSKAIDAARAELAVARSDRSHATLTAPIGGTVAVVDIANGDAVSAGSSTKVITVVGSGALTADLNISLADIDLVKVGQSAQVTVDGHPGALSARVSYVGEINSASSTGSSSTYTVTVALTRTYPSLYDGMGAEVAIDVGTVADTLTVPVSAVHTVGSFHTVQVQAANGTLTRTPVTLGLVGDSVVQVKSGLKAGQRVVLADLSAAVPSSTDTTDRRGSGGSVLSGGGGGFGGPPGSR